MMADYDMGSFANQAPYVKEMIGSSLVALMRVHVDRIKSGQQTMSNWELAFLANAARIGYHTGYSFAPTVTEERLYGHSDKLKRMLR